MHYFRNPRLTQLIIADYKILTVYLREFHSKIAFVDML